MRDKSIYQIIDNLNKSNIPYVLANESLIGLSEGDVNKYSPNLHVFIFEHKAINLILFSLRCLIQFITVKPKKVRGARRYKIRKKSSIFEKEGAFAWIHVLNKTSDGWEASLGKRNIAYSSTCLNPLTIEKVLCKKIQVSVPSNWEEFTIDNKDSLLAEYYPIQPIELNSENELNAIDLLKKVTNEIDKSNVEYWLEGGTLLGAIRDKKLIPWDHDLDIGIKFSNDKEIKQLISSLKKYFFVRPLKFPSDPKIWSLGKYRVIKVYTKKTYFKRSSLCLDIFLYYKGHVKDQGEMYKYVVWGKNACHQLKYFDSLDEITFYDTKFKIPSFSEQFLEVKYGSNWRTPKKHWNVALDDGSINRN